MSGKGDKGSVWCFAVTNIVVHFLGTGFCIYNAITLYNAGDFEGASELGIAGMAVFILGGIISFILIIGIVKQLAFICRMWIAFKVIAIGLITSISIVAALHGFSRISETDFEDDKAKNKAYISLSIFLGICLLLIVFYLVGIGIISGFVNWLVGLQAVEPMQGDVEKRRTKSALIKPPQFQEVEAKRMSSVKDAGDLPVLITEQSKPDIEPLQSSTTVTTYESPEPLPEEKPVKKYYNYMIDHAQKIPGVMTVVSSAASVIETARAVSPIIYEKIKDTLTWKPSPKEPADDPPTSTTVTSLTSIDEQPEQEPKKKYYDYMKDHVKKVHSGVLTVVSSAASMIEMARAVSPVIYEKVKNTLTRKSPKEPADDPPTSTSVTSLTSMDEQPEPEPRKHKPAKTYPAELPSENLSLMSSDASIVEPVKVKAPSSRKSASSGRRKSRPPPPPVKPPASSTTVSSVGSVEKLSDKGSHEGSSKRKKSMKPPAEPNLSLLSSDASIIELAEPVKQKRHSVSSSKGSRDSKMRKSKVRGTVDEDSTTAPSAASLDVAAKPPRIKEY